MTAGRQDLPQRSRRTPGGSANHFLQRNIGSLVLEIDVNFCLGPNFYVHSMIGHVQLSFFYAQIEPPLAKIRFESLRTPVARMTIHFDALIATLDPLPTVHCS